MLLKEKIALSKEVKRLVAGMIVRRVDKGMRMSAVTSPPFCVAVEVQSEVMEMSTW